MTSQDFCTDEHKVNNPARRTAQKSVPRIQYPPSHQAHSVERSHATAIFSPPRPPSFDGTSAAAAKKTLPQPAPQPSNMTTPCTPMAPQPLKKTPDIRLSSSDDYPVPRLAPWNTPARQNTGWKRWGQGLLGVLAGAALVLVGTAMWANATDSDKKDEPVASAQTTPRELMARSDQVEISPNQPDLDRRPIVAPASLDGSQRVDDPDLTTMLDESATTIVTQLQDVQRTDAITAVFDTNLGRIGMVAVQGITSPSAVEFGFVGTVRTDPASVKNVNGAQCALPRPGQIATCIRAIGTHAVILYGPDASDVQELGALTNIALTEYE